MQAETTTPANGPGTAPIDINVSDRQREQAFRRARRHTALVKALKLALPATAVVCLGYYVVTLTVNAALRSGGITVGNVTVDPTNLSMADPRYSGFGKDGSEYKVHAESAVTDIRMAAPIKLNVIDGEIIQPSGVVTRLKANWGTYDQKKDLLELYERIDVDASNGMTARLTRATVFAKESRVISPEPVQAETATGRIRANTMTLDTKARKAQFQEAVEVVLKPSQPAAAPKDGAVAPPKREAQAFGINANAKEPVVVTSRRLDVDDNAKTALFREQVVARQGEASLAAPELDVIYAGRASVGGPAPAAAKPEAQEATKLKLIHARGGVQMINKADHADSQTLDYDAENERITLQGGVVMTQVPDRRVVANTVQLDQREDTALLTGEVVVTQGRNVLRGGQLAIDRKAGTARLAMPAVDGRGAGRISTVLYQGQPQAGKPRKRAAAGDDEGAATALGALGGASFKTDPDAPVEIGATVLDVNDRKHVAVYTGGVVAKQGTFVVKSEELSAFYHGGSGLLAGAEPGRAPKSAEPGTGGSQLKRIEARRGVVVTGAEGQRATGEWANFDVAANNIVMGGNVVVAQGKQIVRAPEGMRLVIDLGSGVTRFEAEPGAATKSASKASSAFATSAAPGVAGGSPDCPRGAVCKSGRLEAIFYPNQAKDAAKNTAKAGAAAAGGAPAVVKPQPRGSAWRSTAQPDSAP
jgi:lipopolysaccharide export system protein LptA